MIIKSMITGFLLGVAAILPGISGGVMAVSMGLYDQIIEAVSNIFSDFKKSITFLIPIGIGAGVSIILVAWLLKGLMDKHGSTIEFLFIGLVVGSLPSLFHEANEEGFRLSYLIPMGITFALMLGLHFLIPSPENIIGTVQENPSFITMMITGGIVAVATIIPGVSSSLILMYMGMYQTFINALATINISILIPTVIGFALIGLIAAKAINYVLKHYRSLSYYAVIGFVISSILMLLLKIQDGFTWLRMGFILMGIVASYLLGKLNSTKKA